VGLSVWAGTTLAKIIEHIFNVFPTKMTVKGDKKVACLNFIGKNISSPENRLIMGVTALVSQPAIDLYNKDVDEKTRKVSCSRTAAKIIAGTITGVSIRYGTIGFIKRLAKVPKVGEKLKSIEKILTPSNIDIAKFQNPKTQMIEKNYHEQYCNTLGTLLGLVVMLYTNFAWDIPLTKYFTNVFNKKLDISTETNSKDIKGGNK